MHPQWTATDIGDLSASMTGPSNIVSFVPSHVDLGYFREGSDGGLFAYCDTTFFGSLSGLGISVHNIVGAVATTPVV